MSSYLCIYRLNCRCLIMGSLSMLKVQRTDAAIPPMRRQSVLVVRRVQCRATSHQPSRRLSQATYGPTNTWRMCHTRLTRSTCHDMARPGMAAQTKQLASG